MYCNLISLLSHTFSFIINQYFAFFFQLSRILYKIFQYLNSSNLFAEILLIENE